MNIRLVVDLSARGIDICCDSITNLQQAPYILGTGFWPITDIDFIMRLNKLDSITWDTDGGAWLDKCDLDADEIALKLLYRNGELIREQDAGYPTICPNCGKDTSFFDESNPIGAYCPHCNKLFDECGVEIPQIRK